MIYSIEHKVEYKEWDELTITADELVKIAPSAFGKSCGEFGFNPTLIFEREEVFVDEPWYLEDGRVRTSSYENGLVNWDENKRQYVQHYHSHERSIGQLIKALFIADRELIAKLKALEGLEKLTGETHDQTNYRQTTEKN